MKKTPIGHCVNYQIIHIFNVLTYESGLEKATMSSTIKITFQVHLLYIRTKNFQRYYQTANKQKMLQYEHQSVIFWQLHANAILYLTYFIIIY